MKNVIQLDFFRDNEAKLIASRALVDVIWDWYRRGKVTLKDAKRFEEAMLGPHKFKGQPK